MFSRRVPDVKKLGVKSALCVAIERVIDKFGGAELLKVTRTSSKWGLLRSTGTRAKEGHAEELPHSICLTTWFGEGVSGIRKGMNGL